VYDYLALFCLENNCWFKVKASIIALLVSGSLEEKFVCLGILWFRLVLGCFLVFELKDLWVAIQDGFKRLES